MCSLCKHLIWIQTLVMINSAPIIASPPAQTDERRAPQWPKELDNPLKKYQSAKMRRLIMEHVIKANGENGGAADKAIPFLLDLREPEICTWLLTKCQWSSSIIRDELPKRKLTIDDAFYLVRSQRANYRIPGPGFQRAVGRWTAASGLGEALCRALNIMNVKLPGNSKAELKKWSQDVLQKALQTHHADRIMILKLQILEKQINQLKE